MLGNRTICLCLAGVALLGALTLDVRVARGTDPVRPVLSPIGASFLRRVGDAKKPALVALPLGRRAEDFGLDLVAPGIARIAGDRVATFAVQHPELRLELTMPLHALVDQASVRVLATTARTTRGADGRGVMVGVADTGLDVLHGDMRDAAGRSRVAWMLDLSREPSGIHADLEAKYGGLVLAKAEIDALIDSNCSSCAPSDEVGHGTHVTGIAAGSGGANGRFVGVAPAADIAFVRVAGRGGEIDNDDLVKAVTFMFDRASAENRPIVANVSLGTDFGPHDGSMLWEQALAAQVGPDHPGHILVAAAGNSGSTQLSPIHQTVFVGSGRTRVPVRALPYAKQSRVQIWATFRPGAEMSVGLEGPDGEWIAPIERGHEAGKNAPAYSAAVINGSLGADSPIPEATNGAVIVWDQGWPSGTYYVTFEGSGVAELYLESLGGAAAGFANGVRQGTVNLPATHPSIIGVGCTISRVSWQSLGGTEVTPRVLTADGDVCAFSSAGPTVTGVPKPEIAAPGAAVVSAMSRDAKPGSAVSTFTSAECPPSDRRCLQVDETHAVAMGTSMSSPVVAGVVALLLQADPTLTQDKVIGLLQAGAHPFRGAAPFGDQSGPGEVDALGSLDALDRMKEPALYLPAAAKSWMVLSSEYVVADGSAPISAIIELRTEDGAHRGDLFDASRLQPVLIADGKSVSPPPALVRRGPGVWVFEWRPPPGLGGTSATFGATFDGAPIVAPRTVPIATDPWMATGASQAAGSSCATTPGAPLRSGGLVAALAALALAAARRHRARDR